MSEPMNPSWAPAVAGGLPVYQAPAISGLPGVAQGFTTRRGGVSAPPYDRLNLGAHVRDDLGHVQENRRRVWAGLGFDETQVAMAEQVHGGVVTVVTAGSLVPAAGADALVTASPGVLLMLYFADCVPVYLVDPEKRVIGLAHAGWRGTAANIAAKTLRMMEREFGCRADACVAAIGPSIAGASYVVGPEVAGVFQALGSDADGAVTPSGESNAAEGVTRSSEEAEKFHLDLRQILLRQLIAAGVTVENIAVSREDTLRGERDFFSYRRDGVTGRMAAYLGFHGPVPSPNS